MTLDISSLRAMRKTAGSNLGKLTAALEKSESKFKEDDRFWKAAIDKAGNGSAVIRFLPAIGAEDLPWVKVYSHGFKNDVTGKWFIENCPTTIGKPSPVVEYCNTLYATKNKADEEKAKKFKRRLSYIANVYIVKDPANPENEGKVKLFKFGKKLHDKIMDKLSPTFEDDEKQDVFDPFVGSNFRLRIAKVDGYSNTDKSTFDAPSELAGGDDEEMLRILNSRHKLEDFIAESQFKSYDELKKKFDTFMSGPAGTAYQKAADFVLEDEESAPVKEQPKPVKAKEVKAPSKVAAATEDEEDLSFFENLVNE